MTDVMCYKQGLSFEFSVIKSLFLDWTAVSDLSGCFSITLMFVEYSSIQSWSHLDQPVPFTSSPHIIETEQEI